MKVPKIVLLIFVSGKVVLTGVCHTICTMPLDDTCHGARTLFSLCPCIVPHTHITTVPTFPLSWAAGAKHREEIYEAFEKIYPTLQEFRKGDAAALLPPAPAPAQQVHFDHVEYCTTTKLQTCRPAGCCPLLINCMFRLAGSIYNAGGTRTSTDIEAVGRMMLQIAGSTGLAVCQGSEASDSIRHVVSCCASNGVRKTLQPALCSPNAGI